MVHQRLHIGELSFVLHVLYIPDIFKPFSLTSWPLLCCSMTPCPFKAYAHTPSLTVFHFARNLAIKCQTRFWPSTTLPVTSPSLRTVLVVLHPLGDILAVTLDPRNLGADSIQALGQRHLKAVGALALEELLNLGQLLLLSEAGSEDGNKGSEHRQLRREPLDELIPVLSHPGEESLDTLGVAAETSSGHVHILVLDLTTEEKVERRLDELGALGAAEAAESGVALIAVGGGTVEVENGVIL